MLATLSVPHATRITSHTESPQSSETFACRQRDCAAATGRAAATCRAVARARGYARGPAPSRGRDRAPDGLPRLRVVGLLRPRADRAAHAKHCAVLAPLSDTYKTVIWAADSVKYAQAQCIDPAALDVMSGEAREGHAVHDWDIETSRAASARCAAPRVPRASHTAQCGDGAAVDQCGAASIAALIANYEHVGVVPATRSKRCRGELW